MTQSFAGMVRAPLPLQAARTVDPRAQGCARRSGERRTRRWAQEPTPQMQIPSLRACVAACVLAGGATAAMAQSTIDPYGGIVPAVGPATGYFTVKQVGNRWMFVTPNGNGMWMTGIYAATYPEWVDDFGKNTR